MLLLPLEISKAMAASSFLNVTTLFESPSRSRGRVSARWQRSYFSRNPVTYLGIPLPAETSYSTRELSLATWTDFERLFSKHCGVGGCWCMYYQRPSGGTMKGLTTTEKRAKNKRDKKSLVGDNRSHGVLLCDRDNQSGGARMD